jgi:hypothetical protein
LTTKCRSCGAPIVWALTSSSKRMPLDADPRADGGFWLISGCAVAVGSAQTETEPLRPRYVSHFATCPNARKHRKAR